MRWLQPSGAWALIALGVIVAMYLLKRRATRTPVGSLLLWKRVTQEARMRTPFQRLKNRLLLWLQLAVALLLVLALMRPATTGGVQGEVILVMDLSASMQTVEGGRSRMERAKDEALTVLGGLRDQDAVTVLVAGATLGQPVARTTDHEAARQAILSLEAGNGGAAMGSALSLAQAIRRDLPESQVIVFTDNEQPDLDAARVVVVGQPTPNRALRSLRLSEDETGVTAFAQVENFGDTCTAQLICYADHVVCDVRTVELAADGVTGVRFSAPATARRVEVRFAENDALAADDAAFAVRNGDVEQAVLLVTEGNVFLQRALTLQAGVSLTTAKPAENADASGYDLVVYDGALPEALPENAALFVLAPDAPVCGIAPEESVSMTDALRVGASSVATVLTRYLPMSDIALRSATPLTGGESVLQKGEHTVLAVAEENGRRVAVLGFSLQNSDLPVKADFPILMQNLLSWLLPTPAARVEGAHCGEPVTLTLDSRTVGATVTTPEGRSLALNGSAFSDTGERGIYTLLEQRTDESVRETLFALHPPLTESDTQQLAQPTEGDASDGFGAAGREWTWLLLLLALVVLMVEWEVSRRVH